MCVDPRRSVRARTFSSELGSPSALVLGDFPEASSFYIFAYRHQLVLVKRSVESAVRRDDVVL
jgi:hypothetical protein